MPQDYTEVVNVGNAEMSTPRSRESSWLIPLGTTLEGAYLGKMVEGIPIPQDKNTPHGKPYRKRIASGIRVARWLHGVTFIQTWVLD